MNVLATVLLIVATCVIAALALAYAVGGYPLVAALCVLAGTVSARTLWILWRDIRDEGDR